jgi:hypothetical protein
MITPKNHSELEEDACIMFVLKLYNTGASFTKRIFGKELGRSRKHTQIVVYEFSRRPALCCSLSDFIQTAIRVIEAYETPY